MSFNFSTHIQTLWRSRFLQRNQEAFQGLQVLQENLKNPNPDEFNEMEIA